MSFALFFDQYNIQNLLYGGKIMKAIGYVRVSTEDQAREGISLDNQRSRIRAFCEAKEWSLIDIVADEGVSGTSLARPGVQRIIDGCRNKEFDVLVIYKLDRLTRSVKDLGFLVQDVFEKYGVAFSSISDNFDTTTANGKLVLNILGSVAQWERDIIVERTKDALQHKKMKLERVGGIPYGFDLEGDRLIPNTEELAVVEKMKQLRSQGLSYYKIASVLNEMGVVPKNNGREWHKATVRNVLSNSIYDQVLLG